MDKIDGYEEAKRQIREALERNATDLHLDGLGLKSLPPELAELTSLTFLTLEANSFDQFPEVLLKLTQLETLYMERNPLERLPNRISELQQLQGLNLYECQLREVPDSIGELKNLDHLELAGNQLTELPVSIGNLTKLDIIGLSNNHFETLPASFGNLASLEWLPLGYNQLRVLPESLVELAKLENIELQGNKLVRLPASFHKLSNLKGVNLSDNPLVELPETLPPLEFLDVTRCYEITQLPSTLSITDTLRLGGQKLKFLPEGCKKATLKWYSSEFEERIIIHPETIDSGDVISAKDHFARESLLNLMDYDQLLGQVEMKSINEVRHERAILRLVKIEVPDGEAETYLMTFDKDLKKHNVKWVLPEFQTCQEAFDWLHLEWPND